MAVRRAALVGCGDVSAVHVEAIAAIEEIDLVAVCDVDPDRLAEAAGRLGVPGFADVDAMLGSTPIDVVHVTTPHHAHADPVLACLDAGVHVLQEKPLAHTLAEGQRIVDAAATARSRVGVCFQNRYNVSSQQLRSILDAGDLGEITGATADVIWTRTADYYRSRPWRGTWDGSGGGVLINQAIHTLDLVQWLMGEVTGVSGHAATRKFGDVIEVEDTAEALFTHAGGAQTAFYATLTAPADRPVEIQITGTLGSAMIRDGLTVRWNDGRVQTFAERQAPSTGRTYWGVSHEVLIRDFYARLEDPEPFWIGPTEAMASLRMLKAIYGQSPALALHN